MSVKPIEKMTFEELRREVQALSDSLAKMKRLYEDALYNLDDDNFSSSIIREKDGMKARIKITAEEIATKVSSDEMDSAISQSADSILLTVSATYATTSSVSSSISQTASEIRAEVSGTYATKASVNTLSSTISQTASEIRTEVSRDYETKNDAISSYNSLISQTESKITATVDKQYITNILGNEYVTSATAGLTISVDNNNKGYIKVYTASGNNESGAIFNKDGLRFYDEDNDFEGWAIEPDSYLGGLLKYYINNAAVLQFGARDTGDGDTNIKLKALTSSAGRFVVDLTSSGYPEVKFVGLNYTDSGNTPYIYANEKLLATQDWVENYAVMYARFK